MHYAIQWYVTTTFGASLFNEVMTVYKKIATSCSPHLQIAKKLKFHLQLFFLKHANCMHFSLPSLKLISGLKMKFEEIGFEIAK